MRGIGCVLVISCLIAGCQQQGAREQPVTPIPQPFADVDLGIFYDTLAPFGEWIDSPQFGPCWLPRRAGPGWKPYSAGRWCYTEAHGWVWAGSDSWSWATDHYGRWTFLDSHGWAWVPDRKWGPAWVFWCAGGGYVGWAALPPGQNVTDAAQIEPHHFTFVQMKFLAEPDLPKHFEPVTRNVTLIAQVTMSATGGTGVPVEQVEEASGQPVPRRKLTDLPIPRAAEVREGEVALHRPEIGLRAAPGRPMPPRGRQPGEMTLEEQRQRLAEYHDGLIAEMAQRQHAEVAELPGDPFKPEIEERQGREWTAFQQQREREVEALRRRQYEWRMLRTAAEEAEAERARKEAQGRPKYEIPPEWELPPQLMPRR